MSVSPEQMKEMAVQRDLRCIPGVGPKYAQLILNAGLSSRQAVLDRFQTEYKLNVEKFRTHLKVNSQEALFEVCDC